jgi:hypothetical protein
MHHFIEGDVIIDKVVGHKKPDMTLNKKSRKTIWLFCVWETKSRIKIT